MKASSSHVSPLLVEWSRTRVRVFDAANRTSTSGTSLAECLEVIAGGNGREAVVAINQRSVFIRALYVPNASRAAISKVLALQLDQLLPLTPGEYVFGFRLGPEAPGKGRLAVIGAIKAETLRLIYSEAATNGLRLNAVVPLAFGSWLAARARSVADCAVVDIHDDAVAIDIIQNGELWYSRSVAAPDSASDIEDEVARSFAIAEIPPSQTLSNVVASFQPDLVLDKDPLEFLAETQTIQKNLFSFELPERAELRKLRAQRWVAQRALFTAVVAIVFGAYAVMLRAPVQTKSPSDTPALRASLQKARNKQTTLKSQLTKIEKSNRILDVAFEPGQSFGDMVNVLANAASPRSWFTGLMIGRGQPLTISGLALNDTDVSEFINSIADDPRFQEMKVVSASKANIGPKQVTQFAISGKPVGSVPFDHPPKEVKRG